MNPSEQLEARMIKHVKYGKDMVFPMAVTSAADLWSSLDWYARGVGLDPAAETLHYRVLTRPWRGHPVRSLLIDHAAGTVVIDPIPSRSILNALTNGSGAGLLVLNILVVPALAFQNVAGQGPMAEIYRRVVFTPMEALQLSVLSAWLVAALSFFKGSPFVLPTVAQRAVVKWMLAWELLVVINLYSGGPQPLPSTAGWMFSPWVFALWMMAPALVLFAAWMGAVMGVLKMEIKPIHSDKDEVLGLGQSLRKSPVAVMGSVVGILAAIAMWTIDDIGPLLGMKLGDWLVFAIRTTAPFVFVLAVGAALRSVLGAAEFDGGEASSKPSSRTS